MQPSFELVYSKPRHTGVHETRYKFANGYELSCYTSIANASKLGAADTRYWLVLRFQEYGAGGTHWTARMDEIPRLLDIIAAWPPPDQDPTMYTTLVPGEFRWYEKHLSELQVRNG